MIDSAARLVPRTETTSVRWIDDRIFNAAWAYDLAFAWDVAPEVDGALAASALGANRGAKVLLPACGTGRYALEFAERGFVVEASDINPAMLSRARLERAHPAITYAVADMTASLGDERDCDAAFTFCNSFRYIVEDREIAGHLESVRERLRTGGRYVVQLGLNMATARLGVLSRWRVLHEDCEVDACWELTKIEAPRSMEVARIRVKTHEGAVHELVEEQPQRLWTLSALSMWARHMGFAVVDLRTVAGAPAPNPQAPGRYCVALERR